NGAGSDDGGGLDAFDGDDEVPDRCMRVRVRLLEVGKILASRLQQSVAVEHVDPRLRIFELHALPNERRTQQVGKTNCRRTRSQEQILLVLKLNALYLAGVDHSGNRGAGGALYVVVVDAVLVAITLQQVDGVDARPILEMYAAFRKHLLYGLNE